MRHANRIQRAISCVIGFVLPLLTALTVEAQSWQSVRARNEASIVFITATLQRENGSIDTVSGSGFIINETGFVITNSHVIPPVKERESRSIMARVGSRDGQPISLRMVSRDDELDLALLKLPEGRKWPRIVLGDSRNVPLETEVLVLGFPLGEDLNSGVGRITSKNGPNGRWLTSLPLNPGNSGGPVFQSNGRVIAVARGGYPNAQLLNELIPIQYAASLLSIASTSSDVTSIQGDWRGRLGSTGSTRFGGAPYCTYGVSFESVDFTLSIAQNVVNGTDLVATMIETATGCSYAPIPKHVHAYRLAGSAINGRNVVVTYTPARTNQPQATLRFSGTVAEDQNTIAGTLIWERTDSTDAFNWVISTPITMRVP